MFLKNVRTQDLKLKKQVLPSSDQAMERSNTPRKAILHPFITTGLRAASPAASIRSDQSMDPPSSFLFSSHQDRCFSPAESCTSVDSDQAMSEPEIKGESYTSLMMRDHLRCSLCKDVLREPVSTPCGHSFCRTCILSYWNKPGSHSCPQCTRRFTNLPALYPNLALANVVQTLKQDLFSPDLSGSGDVSVDDSVCEIITRKQLGTPQEPLAKPGRPFQGQTSSERNVIVDLPTFQEIWEKTTKDNGKGLQLQSQHNKVPPVVAVEPFFCELENYEAMLLSRGDLVN